MSKSTKTLIVWGLLILMFVAIYELLSPETPRAAAPAEPVGNLWLVTVSIAGAIIAALIGVRRFSAAEQEHNRTLVASFAHREAGRFDEAELALAPVLASRLPQFRRSARLQRAEIAYRRADREAALARVDEAISAPIGRLFAGRQRAVVVDARGLAAILRASAGDEAAARLHIEAVRAEAEAEPAVLARAALAEARIADRRGDRAALRAVVERSRALWLASCPPHERALVRAYEAMLDAGSAPVYRQKADGAASAG